MVMTTIEDFFNMEDFYIDENAARGLPGKLDVENISKLRDSGDWSSLSCLFGNYANGFRGHNLNAFQALQLCYEEIPDTQKYDIVLDVYTNVRCDSSKMLRYVKDLKKYAPDSLKDAIRQIADEHGNIIVYRGCTENEKPHCRLSWTVSKRVGEFFALRHAQSGNGVLYKGIIKSADALAYTNDRDEHEILQYRKVKDIEIIGRYTKQDAKDRAKEFGGKRPIVLKGDDD